MISSLQKWLHHGDDFDFPLDNSLYREGKKDEKLGRMVVLDSANTVNSGLFESG